MSGAEVREINCKTLLNPISIPDFPFRWSLNPYRGCRHACRYCYARPTHESWGTDSGREFDQRVFVKVNAPEVLRQELRRPKWRGEPIAIGTASDPYEPAETEYRLTRRLLQVLREFENPASIFTKGELVRRDVDMLLELGQVADVRVTFSLGSMGDRVWNLAEPGTPSPLARLEAMQFLVENGVSAGVMVAPLLPGISDSSESINEVVASAADHGAQYLAANLLFLRPGSREWFMPLLKEAYPRLAPAYATLYRNSYAPREYSRRVLRVVDEARRNRGLPAKPASPITVGPQRQLQLALTA